MMLRTFLHRNHGFFLRTLSALTAVCFSLSLFSPLPNAWAQGVPAGNVPGLPAPGAMVTVSPGFAPAAIKGIKIFPDNPLRFDFIIDTGDSGFVQTQNLASLRMESAKLIKYFLAALTIPEDDMWVNLSPYEQDRIIPNSFGVTEMGRDLLAQDYLLKQLTSTLMYPEEELGKSFWEKVYQKTYAAHGSTDIPVNTFNKVWIVPEKAVVYAKGDTAYVVESRLKVMLEEDYAAAQKNTVGARHAVPVQSEISTTLIREILIPEIEKEVNAGKNFATLRQVYNATILATWFKRNLKESILGEIYVGKNKVAGVDVEDKAVKEKIYRQYLEAFRKGVYNYIKEDFDPATQQTIPRKYFSGGVIYGDVDRVLEMTPDESMLTKAVPQKDHAILASAVLEPQENGNTESDHAALAQGKFNDPNENRFALQNSWRPKFSYRYSEEMLEELEAAYLAGKVVIPPDFPLVRVTEQGLALPETDQIVYQNPNLAKNLLEQGIHFLMGDALSHTEFIGRMSLTAKDSLRKFLKEEGVYEVNIPATASHVEANLQSRSQAFLEDMLGDLNSQYPDTIALLRPLVIDFLSHVPEKERASFISALRLLNSRGGLERGENNTGDFLVYKPVIFLSQWNDSIRKILAANNGDERAVISLLDPDNYRFMVEEGQEVLGYVWEQLLHHWEALGQPSSATVLFRTGIRAAFDRIVFQNDSHTPTNIYGHGWREETISHFYWADQQLQSNKQWTTLMYLLSRDNLQFDRRNYKIKTVLPLAQTLEEFEGRNPIFKIGLVDEAGNEKVVLVKWNQLQAARFDQIAAGIFNLLGVPSYHVQFEENTDNHPVWELIEYHPHDVVAFTQQGDILNPQGFFEVPGLDLVISGTPQEIQNRLKGLGGIFAVEYLLGARDAKMKHILLRKETGRFFRIDWEYLLDFHSRENPNIPSVLKGDEMTFLQVLHGQPTGQQLMDAVVDGLKDTLQKAKDHGPELLSIIEQNLPEENFDRKKFLENLSKPFSQILEELSSSDNAILSDELKIQGDSAILSPVEQTQKEADQSKNDNALVAFHQTPVGGINLNPSGIPIETRGEGVRFDRPINPQQLERLRNVPLEGFSPVIFQIVPIQSVPQLFGLNDNSSAPPNLAAVQAH